MLDSVALVMHFGSLGQKALAAFGTTAGEDGTTALRRHAGAEPKLALTATLGRLVCSLAHNLVMLRCFEVFFGRKRGRGQLSYSKKGVCQAPFLNFSPFRQKT